MKTKILFHHITLISITLCCISCKKFVQIPPPNNQLVSETVFNSDETATTALTGIYSRMVLESNLPYTIASYTGLESDELTNFSTTSFIINIYRNSINSTDNGPTDNIWKIGFNHIYQANAVYEGCKASTRLSVSVKKQLMAEALFVRSYWYFYLVNLYGDVPLLLTTDYLENSKPERIHVASIYEQIIADLTSAESDLPEYYVDGGNNETAGERVRPNKYAAAALLARVALYAGKFSLSEQESTKVISQTATYSLGDLTTVFLNNSTEAIWQLMMPSPFGSNGNSPEGQYFILTSKPATAQQNISTISNFLMSRFEPDDQRKTKWISHWTDTSVMPNLDYYFPFKLKLKNSSSPTEYTTPLRLGEQFLIRAEARVQSGDVKGAKDDLNSIRHRAGLGDTPADNKVEILSALLHERQVELFAEWGHRWFDLKRTKQIDPIMNMVTPIKGAVWQSYQQLWPIPQRDLQNDPNLKQNPGYN